VNDNTYLIPANTKRGILIFSLFTKLDLTLLSIGISITMIMILILPLDTLTVTMIALAPGLISAFLVLPVPNYHNILTVLKGAYEFYTERRKYIWKGWCFDGKEEKKIK